MKEKLTEEEFKKEKLKEHLGFVTTSRSRRKKVTTLDAEEIIFPEDEDEDVKTEF